MDRRDFLKSGSVLAAGVASGAGAATAAGIAASAAPTASAPTAPAIVSGAKELVVSAPLALDDPAFGSSAFRLARRLQDVTEGRFHVSVQRVDTGGIEAVTTGQSDVALGIANHDASYHPAFSVFAALPIGEHLDAVSFNAWYGVGGGAELADDLGRAFGVVTRLAGHSGAGAGLWSEKLIERMDDLKSQTLAVSGLAAKLARAVGADAALLTTDEMRTGLKDGRVFAAEPTFHPLEPLSHWSFGPGLVPGGTALVATIRKSFWDHLSSGERAVFEGVLAEENQRSLAESFARTALTAEVTRKRRLPIALGLGAGLVHDLEAAAHDVVSDLARTDATAQRIVDSHRAFRRLLTGADAIPVA